MTARRCKAGDLFCETTRATTCSSCSKWSGWQDVLNSCRNAWVVARHQDQLRPQYVPSQGAPAAQWARLLFLFPSLERADELLCDALRCAARKVRGRKEATCGKPRGRTPTLALVLRKKTQVSCRGVWDCGRIGGGRALCAHPQYWRRSLRKLPEVCDAGWKLKSGQVEAREATMAAQVARILRGRLRRPGPALQWTRNQCKKRRSLCDRHRVRALERAKARSGGQGWAGLYVGRSVGRRTREVSQSQSQSPFAVGVGVAIAIARHAGVVGPHTQGTGQAQAHEYRHKHRHRHRVGG